MDFHEMRQAYGRAMDAFIERTVDEVVGQMPAIDDLKQRLLDKHAVTYDPICVEAAQLIVRLEKQLLQRELQISYILRSVMETIEPSGESQ